MASSSSISVLLFVQAIVFILQTNLQATNGRNLADGRLGSGVFGNDITKFSTNIGNRHFLSDGGQQPPDSAMLAWKRAMATSFGDMSATSEADHQRFICLFCAKYTHICDPFKVCFL